jgi:hypothetical protein
MLAVVRAGAVVVAQRAPRRAIDDAGDRQAMVLLKGTNYSEQVHLAA